MLAIRALSMAFWSAARLLLICFFWGFSPCLKKASAPAFSLALSAVKYFG